MDREIIIIAAVAENGVIGYKNTIPWKLPTDFKHFKDTTLGSCVVMGKNTYISLGKPLKDRRNIVVSQTLNYTNKEVFLAPDLHSAIGLADTQKIYIIGGSALYKEAEPIADKMIITHVCASVEGDTWLDIDFNNWQENKILNIVRGENDEYFFRVVEYVRIKNESVSNTGERGTI